ncbi:fungal-specific transcription factor domain-containing protein [Talaromyces proteolyticus]|uniref:Fungal-specific transcription factor domain-containing protein n=1 Tax=Talaromyces proteolyticus TaxID=1131652 RepID=A0AAD4KRR1_9EURO|nr:fungal-specific transcription factor domain-containing protein [Talaromyces proteolyticus]KAH8698944.1 fungal-specific transcription factor domain-containing protein [Talaromyces proteolyticus]
MPKQVRRSFDACWTCRSRRVACDAALPVCTPCRRRSLNCGGYSIRLVWVDIERGLYQTHSRRTLDPILTWAGQNPYTAAQIQHLADVDPEDVYCECTLHAATSNPFRILIHSDGRLEPATADSPDTITNDADMVDLPPTPTTQLLSRDRPWTEARLFHHYVDQVAFLMMPVDMKANPWRCVYASIATHHSSHASRSLYHALLALSAFHLSVLHSDRCDVANEYKLQAMKHYCSALGSLRTSLDQQVDEFIACAAVLLTLAQIDGCYAPELGSWRKHFQGVIGLLTQFVQESPWVSSSDAWVISQSLSLSSEIARSGSGSSFGYSQINDTLLGSVSQVSQFGYTIGASGNVIQAISKIRWLAEGLSRGESLVDIDIQSGKILSELYTSGSDCVRSQALENRQEYLSNLHRRIFRNATIIYLYRTVYDVTPCAIQDRVSEVLHDTIDFLNMKGGSISIWPVFIAAVEACTEQGREMARRWLDYSCKLGIRNRHSARHIIQEVWKQRDEEAMLKHAQSGDIAVDWRQVQSWLGIDILLL